MRFMLVFFCFSMLIFSVDDIDKIREKINKIEKNISENVDKLKDVKKQEDEEQLLLRATIKDLNIAKEKYYKAEAEHLAFTKKLDYSEKNLKVAEEELKGKNEELKNEIRQLYYYGDKKKLEYLLGGSSYYEILDRYENISIIVSKSKNDIENINSIKKKIERERSELSLRKEELYRSKLEIDSQKRELDKKVELKNKLIANLKDKEKFFLKEIQELKAQKEAFEAEVKRIIEARVKKGRDSMSYKELIEKIGKMDMPISGDIILGYGETKITDFGAKVKSNGIEIKSKMGERIKAANDGEVVFSDKIQSMGTVVIIDHGFGVATVYGNILKSYVSTGKKIKKGDIFGILGLSQNEREPILYFEVRVNSRNVDPLIFLK